MPPPEVKAGDSSRLLGSPVRRSVALAALLAALTIAAYFPVHRLPFTSLNDAEYVTENLRIQQLNWSTLSWSLTTFHAANWHPLTWLSHAADYQLFSLDPGGHHDSNLLLHALNALLLFWVLWRATARAGRSFMVAALFALHAINVESVAWVAERKNLLSMFFLLLALGTYRWYASQPRTGRYYVVAGCFVLGLMSKPQVVTLPFLLLLWDYWPLQRILALSERPRSRNRETWGTRNDPSVSLPGEPLIPQQRFSSLVLEKLPLLAFSAAASVLTVQAQRAGGAMGGALRSYSLGMRVENAIVCYAHYLAKAIWPVHLAFFYPHAAAFRRLQVFQAFLLLLSITLLVLAFRSRRYLPVGWLWFLGSLVPMIGLLQVGGQAMADRYAYLSFVGLFIAVCWLVADLAQQTDFARVWLAPACVVVLGLLMFATHRQLGYWSDDVSLWSHTVEVTSNNAPAESLLGEALQRAGRRQEALTHFRAAAAIDPLLPYPHYHVGIYDEEQGRPQEAIEQFKRVIALTRTDTGVLAPLRADTFQRMASAYDATGDSAAADACMRSSLQEQRAGRKFELNTVP
jgi:protein O-mannosyl-transferase